MGKRKTSEGSQDSFEVSVFNLWDSLGESIVKSSAPFDNRDLIRQSVGESAQVQSALDGMIDNMGRED